MIEARSSSRPSGLSLYGVDHLAHVTWKPGETADFYREVLELPLVHAVTGVGWLSDDFPDFAHFFFELGKGNYLAFFYFFGLPVDQPPNELMHLARHIALHVDTEEEMLAWRAKVKSHGIQVTPPLTHELLESIYFDDPNGIQLEIVRPLRTFNDIDARDAELTVRALAEVAATPKPTVEAMWQRKADMVRSQLGLGIR
ncbi:MULTISPECIES: VOC family protein [unclassified Micromonospora]|uniref:VOC family protein n=1 Tax=unclassified Micromonospora TaxID=2617518 RepID=UPI003632BDD7